MKMVRLGDICQQARESIRPGQRLELRYIGLESIESGSGMFVEGELSKTPETPMANSFRFGPEHVLYGKLRPYLNKVALPDFEGKCSTEIIPLLPSADIDRAYLGYFLRSGRVVELISARTAGARMPRADMDFIFSLPLPLPPLPEQRRIVDLLSRAEGIVRLRREAEKKAAELIPALFLDMFGHPAMNPKGWEKRSIVGACKSPDDVKCGPFGTQLAKSEFRDSGVPLWGIKHVNVAFTLPTVEFLTDEKAKELSAYSIEPGDIVMTRKGTIGNCALYQEGMVSGVMHSDILRIRPDITKCIPRFLSDQLHISCDVEHQIAKTASSGAVMPGINVGRLKNVQIFLPPLSVQNDYVEKTERIRSIQAQQSAAIAKAQATFDALRAGLFSG